MANGWWLGTLGTGPALLGYFAPPLLFALLAGVAATAETRHRQGSHRGSFARRSARLLPYLVINTGMVPHHFCAFVEGLFGPLHAEFERTPKTASVTAEPGPPTPPHGLAPDIATSPQPVSSASGASARLRRRTYLGTEAAFCISQLGWIAFFVGEGMTLGTLGAAWVVSCVLLLRAAPAWQARTFWRRTAAAGAVS